jgi:hypothetical protein
VLASTNVPTAIQHSPPGEGEDKHDHEHPHDHDHDHDSHHEHPADQELAIEKRGGESTNYELQNQPLTKPKEQEGEQKTKQRPG